MDERLDDGRYDKDVDVDGKRYAITVVRDGDSVRGAGPGSDPLDAFVFDPILKLLTSSRRRRGDGWSVGVVREDRGRRRVVRRVRVRTVAEAEAVVRALEEEARTGAFLKSPHVKWSAPSNG